MTEYRIEGEPIPKTYLEMYLEKKGTHAIE
jgi:hypothetical protein